jgi:hypothetical protein
MALLNLSQAKNAAGTAQEIKYIYNGPASWPVPVAADKVGSNKVVYSEKVSAVSAAAKSPAAGGQGAGAPAAKSSGSESYDMPMFVPANKEGAEMPDSSDIMGPKDPFTATMRPMHMFNLDTRGHFLGKRLGFEFDGIDMSDSWTGVYNSFFWSMTCFILMIVTFFVNPIISVVFAYLWGHYWGWHLNGFGTEVGWQKGRSVIVAQ